MVNAPSISLKVVFITHLVLTAWAAMALLPVSYLYMNSFVLAFGLWAIISQEATDAVLMFFITNLVAIVMDIIYIGIYASLYAKLDGLYRFSLAMAIINLLVRPVSSFIIFRLYQDRTGQYSDFGVPGMPGFGVGAGGSPRSGGYENIDHPVPSNNVETASPHSTIDKSPISP